MKIEAHNGQTRIWRIALAGNPNSGKTTLFNNLTGARQKVANYPGVTVERKEGELTFASIGQRCQIIDLPGTYSLVAHSPDEVVARNSLLEEPLDLIINIIDSANLERNLFLTLQLLELHIPLLLVLNMADTAQAKGFKIDVPKISTILGVPTIEMVGHKNQGTDRLMDKIQQILSHPELEKGRSFTRTNYGQTLEPLIERLMATLPAQSPDQPYPPRFWAIKLLENDSFLRHQVLQGANESLAKRTLQELDALPLAPYESAIALARYQQIATLSENFCTYNAANDKLLSDRIDRIVLHRYLGLPLFFLLMYLLFYFTFTIGDPLMTLIESAISALAGWLNQIWPASLAGPLKSLLLDGVLGGVGGVIVFLPNILLLFFAIALLEGSGLMSRAAFLLDRLMNRLGLSGKSFIPMVLGLGCSVPAIMATRVLEKQRDRLITMLVIPLISCGARLPIYSLLIPAFFPRPYQATILWLVYLFGILLAIVAAKLLGLYLIKGEAAALILELPPYRMPTLKSLIIHMWERAVLYVQKAGTTILGVSILLWALTTYPQLEEQPHSPAEALAHSAAGQIGRAMEPLLAPMGFDWRIGTALLGAFAAKEVFVSQMAIIFSMDGASASGDESESSAKLRARLRQEYSPLQGLCLIIFCLISSPCMATVAITKRESNSWGWALTQFGGLTLLAYLITTAIYQLGIWLNVGTI